VPRASIRIVVALLFAAIARADVPAGDAAYESGDYATALREWLQPAEKGAAEAQYGMGRLYFYGQGVDQNYATAAEWYAKAAAQGHARSQTNLGHIYEQGLGVEPDPAQAARWYRAAAESGRPMAQLRLGRLYEVGRGVAKDLAEAVRWYGAAAAQGDTEARSALDRIERTGDTAPDVPSEAPPDPPSPSAAPESLPSFDTGVLAYDRGDYDAALRIWVALAQKGDAEAHYRVGSLYRSGLGVPIDLAEAGRWYQRAADLGHGEAMYHLGFLYLRGRGVTRRVEYGLAHAWFNLAAGRGIGDAAAWRDRIAPRLTAKERRQSDRLQKEHAPPP